MKKTKLGGKELLFETLKHKDVPAVPWVPYAGVHAGKLKGYTAKEVLTDGNKLFDSLIAVNEIYDPDGQPVVFDLQIEAEILGCEMLWADKNPPSVATNPLSSRDEIPDFLIEPKDGRLPIILDVMRRMKKSVGDHTALFGLVCGPLTLASHLRGVEVFTDMIKHPGSVEPLIGYCAKIAKRVSEFYIDAGMDIIAMVDPVLSQISNRLFTRFLSAPYLDIFTTLRQAGVYSSFFVCGDATKNIEVMCQTAPDSIAVDENLNMLTTKEITDRYNITLAGNIPLTTHMLFGTQQDNMKFTVDLLDQMGHKNYILAPGCDMPYEIPIENVVGIVQAVRDTENTRKMIANYQSPEIDTSSVVVPDYEHLERPLIEVFTLDSDTCAACTYMLKAAQRVVKEMAGQVDMVEYKFTKSENVARVVKMGITKLPSILINGELKYSSIIPNNEEFIVEVKRFL
ncbi:MAG TPA: uroporphyrinogen decarboxylase family protein [Syntrophorhabdaceae bacterium]|nr:uroporphyrinogen decarboxylase family protein [Syntrophorhabdaceae bacterium]HQM81049.1 uroporphyrinogen decarboxylase family protein [Syntrophorhabdaceae bacterium]